MISELKLFIIALIPLLAYFCMLPVQEGMSCSLYGIAGNSLNQSRHAGLHFKIPYVQSKCIDMRPQKMRYENVEIHARNTSKSQSYPLIYVKYRVTDPVYILNNYNPEIYEDKIVEEKFRAITYSVCTKYNERQLIFEKIEEVEQEIFQLLSDSINREGIHLEHDGVQIVKPPGPMSNELHEELQSEAKKRKFEKEYYAQLQEDNNKKGQIERESERKLILAKADADALAISTKAQVDASLKIADAESKRFSQNYLTNQLYMALDKGTKWIVPGSSIDRINLFGIPSSDQ